VAALPPGFGLRAARFQHAAGGGPLGHLVYSDGVAVVSVFIEAGVTPVEQREGLSALGAANAFTMVTEGQLVTAVGEVPARTVESMARSVRRVGAPGR
jgi:sigma-E factor negative regulatory protein RseB